MKVLLVDDDVRLLHVLAKALEGRGYEVVRAETVTTALSSFERVPGVVVTDLGVGDGSGLDILAAVEGLMNPVPVIVMSGPGRSELLEALRSRPSVAAVLEKPFAIDALLEALKRATSSR